LDPAECCCCLKKIEGKNKHINHQVDGDDFQGERSRAQCYDFKNIFSKKLAKNWRFLLKLVLVFANI
jgi:hypothetical protein